MTDAIIIDGACENNLKNISVKIPHNAITLVCGRSGSGKSTLAVDIIHNESRRHYFQTFSSYARQFLEKVAKPLVLKLENIRCSVCVAQRRNLRNSRSTVGSSLGVLDNLKILFKCFADLICPKCHSVVKAMESHAVVEKILSDNLIKNLTYVCGKLPIADSIEWNATKEKLLNKGFFRALRDGKPVLIEQLEQVSGELFVIVDRFNQNPNPSYLKNAVQTAFDSFGNACLVTSSDCREFQKKQSCWCGYLLLERNFELFDSSSSLGACKECKGFGYVLEYDLEKIVDANRSLAEGALVPLKYDHFHAEKRFVESLLKKNPELKNLSWPDVPPQIKDTVLYDKHFGILTKLKKLEGKAYLPHIRIFLSRFRKESPCGECFSTGLDKPALMFELNGFGLADLFKLEISELVSEFIPELERYKKSGNEINFVISVLEEKLRTVVDLKLGHLTLGRKLKTLSTGEFQRLTIAAAIGSPLSSLQYILDEPSAGLHPTDNYHLAEKLLQLANKNNTVILIEHDPYFLSLADTVVHLGPGSGKEGGNVVFCGNRHFLDYDPFSISENVELQSVEQPNFLTLSVGPKHNVKNQTIKIALNSLNVVAGVSGSGKSTFLQLMSEALENEGYAVLYVDQSFVQKNARSIIASYLGFWGEIRAKFFQLTGLSKSYFSFNVSSEGRCSTCKGLGYIVEDLQFLPDLKIVCSDCEGMRYSPLVLDQRVNGLNILDVLNLTLDEIERVLPETPQIVQLTRMMGLGYLRLGQSLSEISVGEAQRLKLLRYISKTAQPTFILFDEPTIGLHPLDTVEFIKLIGSLLGLKHTVLTTEHNLLVIQNANHIIELGPEGGSKGGRVIFQGSPEALRSAGTPTARALTEKTKFKTQVFARVKYQNVLEVLDCRQRNLKIDHLKIPYNKLVVFTGPSGAGKSSLVFETIAGEAQRLFLNNLSPYTLSFLDILPKPTVGVLKNLKPAIFLEQYYAIPSEFSSLGTLTDTLSYLRLLYAKRGTQYCPKHKKPLVKIEMEDLIREIQRENGHRLICGTLVSGRKGLFKDLLQMIYKSEAEGALIDGIFFPRTRLYFAKLDKNKQHYIDVVVGSFDPSKTSKALIEEAVRFANKFNAKIIKVFNPSTRASILYSLEKACPVCNIATRNLDPEDFSFSSKRGRCNECGGYGVVDNKTCSACCGTGINETALNVLFYGKNIGELSSMRVADLYSFFLKANRVDQVTRSILDEILPKLKSLIDLGLGYLSLDRRLSTLSSGELQRARLASVLNTPLRDVLIVLDEPTASLHPLDVELVIKKIKEQVKNGNSIFMVEHDIQAIMESDHVIELGPGGGEEGGHVVFEGPIKNFPRCGSKTAIAVEQRKNVYYSAKKIPSSYIFVKSSKVNNLRVENLKIPTECLVVICGRSGSGKTSLALKTIFEGFYNPKSKLYDVKFPSNIEEAVYVDQTLISKNSRATPATFLKIFDEIRRIFSLLPQAKALGLSPSSFSFNSKKWVCEVCKGSGLVTHELGFLRHEIVRCQACQGKRYKNELLSIKFKGYSIAEVLELTFKEAGKVFLEFRNVARLINEVIEIGLGYLKLGQPLSSLSGGENQRLKLVKNLVSGQRRKLLFVLDEPTLGLHSMDVPLLISKMRALVSQGHSVIIVEHDELIIKSADFLIEMGPGVAEEGGQVVFSGSPQEKFSCSHNTECSTSIG